MQADGAHHAGQDGARGRQLEVDREHAEREQDGGDVGVGEDRPHALERGHLDLARRARRGCGARASTPFFVTVRPSSASSRSSRSSATRSISPCLERLGLR